jgi:hypothetical protein
MLSDALSTISPGRMFRFEFFQKRGQTPFRALLGLVRTGVQPPARYLRSETTEYFAKGKLAKR